MLVFITIYIVELSEHEMFWRTGATILQPQTEE